MTDPSADRLDILCLGEAMVEFNQTGGAGSEQYLRGFGGDTSNCAIAAARQGVRAGYCTLVGNDPFGDLLLDLWRREGVDTAAVGRRANAATAVYFVTHTAQGHTFTYYREHSAASRIAPADLPADLPARTRFLQASGISLAVSRSMRETVMAAIAAMRSGGGRVAFDTNLRLKLWPLDTAREAITEALKLSDIALPSLDDARGLTGLDAAAANIGWFRDLGIPLVALKCGGDGVLLADRDGGAWRLPGHRVDSVDATGAGDCFDGAFLAELARGAKPLDAALYANAAAALTTAGYGAVAPIPHRKDVESFLREAGAGVTPQPA
jgi:2-dehydro-3-deoxygluconokinase